MRGGDGAEVIYPLRNNNVLPNMILDELSREGQNIRNAYQRRLPSNPSKDYYFMQRNTGDTESLTVEYGFLDSTKDDPYQLKNNYRNLAEAVVRAVTEYIGMDYTPTGSSENTYVVKRGDSLYSIASRYNTSVSILKNLNNLTSNTLQIGQILKLPIVVQKPEPSNANTYIVKKGDNLYSIANKFNTTVDVLKSLNNLTNNNLSIGQVLILQPEELGEDTYTVKSGDTLYSIAKNNNTDVNTLKTLNNLTTNTVSIGQVLKLPNLITPPIEEDNNLYIVQSGDSLYAIARKYDVNVNDIISLNNLTDTILKVGQTLQIPTANIVTYTVQKGDTLYNIARQFNVTIDDIINKNNLTSNVLSIGQVLTI